MKGGDRKGLREGRWAGSTERERESEPERENQSQENKERLQTRRKEMKKQQEPKLAWVCVLWLCKNSIFC